MSKTKVHRVVLLIVDTDDIGESGVRDVIPNTRYPNRCIAPEVIDVETREVEWSDSHPLNSRRTQRAAFDALFTEQPPDPKSDGADAGKNAGSDASAAPPIVRAAREWLSLHDKRDDYWTGDFAEAVLAQDEELQQLRTTAWTCPRCGRADLQAQHAVVHRQSCMSRTDDEERIDALRAALAEALDEAEGIPQINDYGPDPDLVARLRRLANDE